jgi:hypothetical protein
MKTQKLNLASNSVTSESSINLNEFNDCKEQFERMIVSADTRRPELNRLKNRLINLQTYISAEATQLQVDDYYDMLQALA